MGSMALLKATKRRREICMDKPYARSAGNVEFCSIPIPEADLDAQVCAHQAREPIQVSRAFQSERLVET